MFFLSHFQKLIPTWIISMIKIKMKMFCKRMACGASPSHKTFLRLGNVISLNIGRKFKILHYWSYKHYYVVACCLWLILHLNTYHYFFNFNIFKSFFGFICNAVSQKLYENNVKEESWMAIYLFSYHYWVNKFCDIFVMKRQYVYILLFISSGFLNSLFSLAKIIFKIH